MCISLPKKTSDGRPPATGWRRVIEIIHSLFSFSWLVLSLLSKAVYQWARSRMQDYPFHNT